ncbi:hypothetical protein Droror1_Dr00016232 [Drosera rotundifolia]
MANQEEGEEMNSNDGEGRAGRRRRRWLWQRGLRGEEVDARRGGGWGVQSARGEEGRESSTWRWLLSDVMLKGKTIGWSVILANDTMMNLEDDHVSAYFLFESVLELFREMEPRDLYSFGTVLRACAGLAAMEQGKEVHCQYLRKGGWKDVIVESALVDLYAKSGHVNYAQRIFHQMVAKNLISWNSMICGLAQNGHGEEAVNIYNRMIEEGIKPKYITFVGVLFACSHGGLVDHGREYFHSMNEKYGVKPGIEHFNCMVDLLGRAGLVEEAEELIKKAGCKDVASLWLALLGSCITCRNFTAAERVAKSMIEHDPENHLSYVHLTNVYKAVGRWNDAIKIRELMKAFDASSSS